MQHAPTAEQVSFWQQGWPVPPHATDVPASHTLPAVVVVPDAAHFVPPTQQPAPLHTFPGQHASPCRPQAVHLPPEHVPPPMQADALVTQTLLAESQQPVPPHVAPAQHGCPGPPQASHTAFGPPPPQANPAVVHALPAQHAWPGPPQLTHT